MYDPNMSEEEFEAYKAEAIEAVNRGEKHELVFLAMAVEMLKTPSGQAWYRKNAKDFKEDVL